jgi:COP9 signalosome complex subunit 5
MSSPNPAQYFTYDEDAYGRFLDDRPFKDDPRWFTSVYVTPRALLTMMNHSLTTTKEIMGFLFGRAEGHSFYVTDAFPFAVQGCETRVNATAEVLSEFFAAREERKTTGRLEMGCGWYHSHPGLKPFLSEIDVKTQRNNQTGYGAFCALVIDPINTASSGKVQLGGYITLPYDERTIDSREADDAVLRDPVKMEKYGSAADRYYELEIRYFKTAMDTKVLSDVITRSYGQAIACSPLDLNASYVGKRVEEAGAMFRKMGSPDAQPGTVESALKLMQRVNEDRRTGVWIEKMKRAAFG